MNRVWLLISLVFVCSCLRKEEGKYQEAGAQVDFVPARVYIETPQLQTGSKSTFVSDDMSRLTDLNVFVYHNGILLREHSGYFEDISSLMLSFPVGKNGFDIYMFGNVGRCTAPELEADISDMRYVVGDYDEFRKKGVPVAGRFMDFQRGTLADFPLKRLVGQFDIRMRQSAEQADYKIKDIRVMNCALDVYPFSDNKKARMFSRSYQYDEKCLGDMLTDEDICKLNEGHSVSLYFVENLQGELLPDNTDRKAKIPSSLSAGVAECCTYVEITADVTTQMARYTDARYRFYPGENETTDFSIRRNTLYEVVLDFTQNMVYNQEWRIETSDPEVIDVWMDKQEAMVINGAEDMIFVRALDNKGNLLDFDVEPGSSSGYINVDKEIVQYNGVDYLGVKLTSNIELMGVYPIGSDPPYIADKIRLSSIETYNGKPLFVKEIPVRIYYKLFPLYVSLERDNSSDPYSIVLRSRNPMGLGVSVSSSYVSGGVSKTTDQVLACNYETIVQGERVFVNDAVGISPRVSGSLSSTVRYNNLTSLNLSVSGVADESVEGLGYILRYPKLQKQAQLFTGDDSKAFFGPGSSLRPARGTAFPDDGECNFDYVVDGVRYQRSITNEKSVSARVAGLMPLCMCYKSKVYMNVGDDHCSGYLKVTGCGGVQFNIKNQAEHAALPFYIVNAVMFCTNTLISPSAPIGNWNNKTTRGVVMDFLGPGRDLFSETRTMSITTNRRHSLEFYIEVWKNLFGTFKSQQYCRDYVGGSYLTVNGASSWVGGDISDFGVSADEI